MVWANDVYIDDMILSGGSMEKSYQLIPGASIGGYIGAQKYAETMAESARRQADALLEEARLTKIRAEMDAAELPETLRDEIEALKRARNRLREDLMAVIETHGVLAENIPAAEIVHSEQTTSGGGSDREKERLVDVAPWSAAGPLTVDRSPWLEESEDEDSDE